MAHFCKKLQADCRRGWIAGTDGDADRLCAGGLRPVGADSDGNGHRPVGTARYRATIIEQGTTNGATTGVDGSYSLKLRGGGNSANLIFQSLGFVSQTVAVNGRTKIDVKTRRRRRGPRRRGGDRLRHGQAEGPHDGRFGRQDRRPGPPPDHLGLGALQGKAAGVQVIQPNGSPGQGMVVRVRGASSISSCNDPLYVVDGVPVGEGNYAIAYLSPNEIESMQVLKDASSAAIYGSRAANGVVLITTKQGSRKRGPEISFSTSSAFRR